MSYKITIDGHPFCASNVEASQILNPKVKLEANRSGSLTFTMIPDHPYYDAIEFRQSIFDVFLNDELIFEGIPVSEQTDFFNRKTVTCEGELTFLNDTIQRQAVYENQTVQTLLGAYLTVHNAQADVGHQFTLGVVTVDGGNAIYRYTNYQSTMQELQDDLVENFGGFFRVRHDQGVRYLDYLAASPHSSSQIIRIGKNLVDLSRNLSSLDICTVLIPLGAKTGESVIDGLDERLTIKSVNNDKDYLVGTAQAYYGNIWKTHVWDEVTTASELKTKGQAFLDDAQWSNLVIEATAFDLGLATEEAEQLHVLDMIRVVSEPHGIDRFFMLTKLEIDLDHPGNTRITLGQDARLSLSAQTAKTSGEVERQQTTLMVNASENARSILDSATDGAIQILYNSDGVAYEMRINNSQNPDTATSYWRYNAGGWGYYDAATDTYTTAATMDGTIFANLIKAGILSSDNGKYSLDMETGTVNMANANITGGMINIETESSTMDMIQLSFAVGSSIFRTKMASAYFRCEQEISGQTYAGRVGPGFFSSYVNDVLRMTLNYDGATFRNSSGNQTAFYSSSGGMQVLQNSGSTTLTMNSNGCWILAGRLGQGVAIYFADYWSATVGLVAGAAITGFSLSKSASSKSIAVTRTTTTAIMITVIG